MIRYWVILYDIQNVLLQLFQGPNHNWDYYLIISAVRQAHVKSSMWYCDWFTIIKLTVIKTKASIKPKASKHHSYHVSDQISFPLRPTRQEMPAMLTRNFPWHECAQAVLVATWPPAAQGQVLQEDILPPPDGEHGRLPRSWCYLQSRDLWSSSLNCLYFLLLHGGTLLKTIVFIQTVLANNMMYCIPVCSLKTFVSLLDDFRAVQGYKSLVPCWIKISLTI